MADFPKTRRAGRTRPPSTRTEYSDYPRDYQQTTWAYPANATFVHPARPYVVSDEAAIQAVYTQEGPTGHGAGSLAQSFQDRVRPMIDLIDRLRKLGLNKDVDLPTIVVVGDQSAGKSSVLEAISGVQLPRGTGIVTRCPLEIRMKSGKKDTPWRARIHYTDEDDDEFTDELTDPAQVANHVREAQGILAGDNKGISADLISLEVESYGIPDLTVIDLPGICRVPVGDQPADIADQVKKLIKGYIERDNTIILAVVPATVDIATTEALQMAKQVDPDLKRTIGVITKPDLIDKGSEDDLVAAAENQKYRLRKGYFVVRCRGQRDINDNMSLEKGLQEETEFFSTAKHFRNLLENGFVGSKNLSRRLTEELVDHIKEVLPALQEAIRGTLYQCKVNLTKMGVGLPKQPKDKTIYLMKIVHEYVDDIKKLARGQEEDYPMANRLFTNSRVEFVNFSMKVQEQLLPDDFQRCPYFKEVREQIEGLRGRELPSCISFTLCRKLITKLLDKFKTPADECLGQVERLVSQTITTLSDEHFKEYEDLSTSVARKQCDIFEKSFMKSTQRLDDMLEMEKIVFTQDSQFYHSLGDIDARRNAKLALEMKSWTMGQLNAASEPKRNVDAQAELVYKTIQAYMQVCIRRICDNIPMVITQYMILQTTHRVAEEIPALIADPTVLERFQEKSDVAVRRMTLTTQQDRLQEACRALSKITG